jgi:S1-C subfamily serine protease
VRPRHAVAAVAAAAALAAAGCAGDGPTPTTPTMLKVTIPGTGRVPDVATAFSISEGRAVTVAHAVGGHRIVLVAAPGQRARRARVVRTNARLDLALLDVPGLRAPVFGSQDLEDGMYGWVQVLRGDQRLTLHAQLLRRITANVRDAPGAAAQVRPALELRTEVMQGDSGAPVLDLFGRVIGMIFAQASDRDDRAYALDASAFDAGYVVGP